MKNNPSKSELNISMGTIEECARAIQWTNLYSNHYFLPFPSYWSQPESSSPDPSLILIFVVGAVTIGLKCQTEPKYQLYIFFYFKRYIFVFSYHSIIPIIWCGHIATNIVILGTETKLKFKLHVCHQECIWYKCDKCIWLR